MSQEQIISSFGQREGPTKNEVDGYYSKMQIRTHINSGKTYLI